MLVESREAQEKTSTFVLRAGRQPGIDLTTQTHGSPRPLHTKAIYELQGDALKYCIGAPGIPRPTAFTTTPGDGRTLVVLRRL
jgi:uncharacterized protein (TIGR03067 family)